MEEITAYKTSDGKLFTDEDSARQHEKALEFINWCEDNLCKWQSEEGMAKDILEHWDVTRKGNPNP